MKNIYPEREREREREIRKAYRNAYRSRIVENEIADANTNPGQSYQRSLCANAHENAWIPLFSPEL